MASLNKCFFIGNLTRDPELRFLATGEAVANVSIACNETYKNKSGEKVESVEFVNLVFYRKLAEIVNDYCRKGSSIHVEGKMKTRSWEDKEGVKKYATEIVVNEMQMLGSKQDQGSDSNRSSKPESAPAKDKPAASKGGAFSDMEDDLPFADPYKFCWRSV